MSETVGNAAARDEVVLRLSKEEYKGMQEALSEHDRLCEMLSESRKSVGNAAAMREALVDFSRSLYNEALYCCTEKAMIGKYDNTQLSLCKSCVAMGCECWQMTLAREAKTALSAPARNCDLFDNWYDAHQAWERLPKDELGYFVDANGVHECEQAWLFAPAAERKGEEK